MPDLPFNPHTLLNDVVLSETLRTHLDTSPQSAIALNDLVDPTNKHLIFPSVYIHRNGDVAIEECDGNLYPAYDKYGSDFVEALVLTAAQTVIPQIAATNDEHHYFSDPSLRDLIYCEVVFYSNIKMNLIEDI